MPDDNHNEPDDQKRAERAHHASEAPAANIGLLSPGTQTDFHTSLVDDSRAGASGAPPPPPAYPMSMLGDPVLYEPGNEPVRISVMTEAQRTYGNRAVQRFLQRRAVAFTPVQRDDYVPPLTLQPPSLLQPPDPLKQYGLRGNYRLTLDPRTAADMNQYVLQQMDIGKVQSAGVSFPPPDTVTPSGQTAPGTSGTPAPGSQPAQTPPAPSSPPSSGAPPNQPGAGPDKPQQAGPGQILSAALASEPFKSGWSSLQNQIITQAKIDWSRLKKGEQVALVTTTISIAVGALAGIALTDDPSARQLVLGQLNGKTLPIPGVDWMKFEMNAGGDNLMFGLHADIGALLGPRFGFRPSSITPLGGVPRLSLQPPGIPPAPTQRQIQRRAGDEQEPVQRFVQRSIGSVPHLPVQRDTPPVTTPAASTENFKITNDTFDIQGTTLADAAAVLKGLGDAADTTWHPIYNSNEVDGKVTSVTIDVDINVLMPNWPGASNLNKEAKAEWDRAYKALADHEQGHVDLVKKKLTGVAARMVGKTKAQADAIFKQAVADLKKESDAYDKTTDHGRKTGTIINEDAGKQPPARSEPGTKQSTSNEFESPANQDAQDAQAQAMQPLQLMHVAVQRGFWGADPATTPKTPQQTILPPHLAELKDPEKAYFQLKQNYITDGEDGQRRFIDGVQQQVRPYSPDDQKQIMDSLHAQDERLNVFKTRFITSFEASMHDTVETMLAESDAQIKAEQQRYGLTEQGKDSGKYSMQQNQETKELAEAAREIVKIGEPMVNLQIKLENEAKKKHDHGPMYDPNVEEAIQRDVMTNPELVAMVERYEQVFNNYAGKFPILAAFRDNPTGLAALANGGKNPAAAAVIGKELKEKQDDIQTTRDNMNTGKLKLWSLPNVVNATKKKMSATPGTIENRIADDTNTKIQSDETIKKIAIAAIGIAIAIIGAVATAGGSLIVAGAAAAGGAAMSTAALLQDIQEYRVQSAANNTSLDKAKAVSQTEPSLIWVAMDMIALGMDVFAAAAAFKKIAGPIKDVLEAQRLARAAKAGEEGAEATSRLAKMQQQFEDALKIVPEELANRIKGKVGAPQRGFLVNPDKPLGGAANMGATAAKGKGFGAFEGFIPGHSEPVVIKIYPDTKEMVDMFHREMDGVKAAEKTGIGPKFLGEVDMGAGKKAFAMEKVAGGSVHDMADVGTKAAADIAKTASRINVMTINDVRQFGERIRQQGYYVRGDLQGLIDSNGRWRPIDLQSTRKLADPLTQPDWYKENLRMHQFAIDSHIEMLQGMAPKPLPPALPGQLPHVSTPP